MNNFEELFVKISADISGFKNKMREAANSVSETLKGVEGGFKNVGGGIQNLGKSISGFGDTLTRRITVPAAAAATALGGITLAKGFGRLTGIDTAQAKLKGLGHDAKSVEQIMESALDSVRGTAHGMDEAATSAAGAVAAGVKPGKELTRYLTITGDAAAIAGSSMAEMGSIFGKVQTAQKAYTGELNQLADRGIPIFQWLADEAGTTAEGVREMASNGEISSDMFLKAIENNIGGAAKKMGEESFTAGIANIGAALGRLGANFLDGGGSADGFFSTVKSHIPDVIAFIDGLADKAAEMGTKFGQAFGRAIEFVKDMKAKFDALSPATQEFIKKAALIGSIVLIGIGPAISIIGTIVTGVGGAIAAFGGLIGIVSKVAGVFALLSGPMGLVAALVAGLGVAVFKNWDSIKEKTEQVFGGFPSSIGEVFEFIQEKVMGFVDIIKERLQPVVEAFLGFFEKHGPPLFEIFSDILGTVTDTITDMGGPLGNITKLIGEVISSLGDSGIIYQVFGTIQEILGTVGPIITETLGNFVGLLTELWDAIGDEALSFLGEALDFVGGIIKDIVGGAGGQLPGIFETIKDAALNLVEPVKRLFDTFKNLFNTVEESGFISEVFQTVGDIIGKVVPIISELLNDLLTIVADLWSWIGDDTLSFLGTTFSFVAETIENAVEIIGGVLDILFGLLTGDSERAAEGFEQVISSIGEILLDVGAFLWEAVPELLGIIGKILYEIGNNIGNAVIDLFIKIGNWLIDGIVSLIQEGLSNVGEAIEKIKEFLGKYYDYVAESFGKVKEFISGIFEKIGEIFSNAWNGIKEFFSNWLGEYYQETMDSFTKVRDFIFGIFEKIGNFFQETWTKVKDFFSNWIADYKAKVDEGFTNIKNTIVNVFTTVKTKITETLGNIKNIGMDIITGIWQGIKDGATWLWDKVAGFARGIIDKFKSVLKIKSPSRVFADEGGAEIVAGVWEGIKGAGNWITGKVVDFGKNLVEGVKKGAEKVGEMGKNIAQGVGNGIQKGASWAADKAKGLAQGIQSVFKKENKIKSPSRVFEEIAGWIPKGVGKGIEDNTKEALDPVLEMANEMVKGFDPQLEEVEIPDVEASGKFNLDMSEFDLDLSKFDLKESLNQLKGKGSEFLNAAKENNTVNIELSGDLAPLVDRVKTDVGKDVSVNTSGRLI